MSEKPPPKHVRDRHGTAVCGQPARLEDIVDWGDHDCKHCAALYARRVWAMGS